MKLKKLSRKGQLGGLAGTMIALTVSIVVLVLGLVIIQEMRDVDAVSECPERNASDPPSNCEAYSSANASLVGLGDFADFIPLIVIAVAATIVIGLILAGFAFRGRR